MKRTVTIAGTSDILIFFLALLSVTLHLIFNGNLEYHRDELLYFSLGLHPAFGYATVPPLIGWVAWLMQNIFGYSLFAVRLFPAVMSGIMVFLVSKITRELGGKNYAAVLAGLGMMTAIFSLRTFSLFQPVHIDLFFWTLSIYLVIKYINEEDDKYLLLFGIVAGLSLLNKYLIGLLFILLLIVIPFTHYRNIFGKRKFWTGIVAGIVVFSPNLIWQLLNGMPVINHLAELERTQLVNVDRIGFLKDQIIMPGAVSLLTLAGLIHLIISRKQGKFRILWIVSIMVVISLMLLRGKSYYTIGIFPFLMAAGAVFYESVFKIWIPRSVMIVIICVLTFFIMPYGLPVYKAEGLVKYFDKVESQYKFDFGRTFEDGSKHSLPQDYADMTGWEELTQIADKAWQRVTDKKAAFIYCENYGQAGAITIIGKKYGLPEAVCFSESFRYWIPKKFDPDVLSLVYINDEMGDDVRQLFGRITEIGKISNPDAREYGTTVWLCESPLISFNEFWTSRLEQLNNKN